MNLYHEILIYFHDLDGLLFKESIEKLSFTKKVNSKDHPKGR